MDYLESGRLEAGCDEAGRGCLAGPVFAAAVILPNKHGILGLNDSKKLNSQRREELRREIEDKALSWAVAQCSEAVIDKINILNASFEAMHLAIDDLDPSPEFLLIDGNRFPPKPNIPHKTIIKGDGKFSSIAAASILAKTHRDAYMLKLHELFPIYGFDKHKGYATAQHRQAIGENGYCDVHRKSFHLKEMQLNLF